VEAPLFETPVNIEIWLLPIKYRLIFNLAKNRRQTLNYAYIKDI